jgi:hypothetical protein
MAIKQLGGVFGRNPTFNDVEVDGTLEIDGSVTVNSEINVNAATSIIESTAGAQLYLSRNDTAVANNNLIGGLAFKGNDSSASPDPQYCGIKAYAAGSGNNPVLEFYSGNGNYDARTPQLSINYLGNVTIANGNLIMGTSGNGIDFSATSDAPGKTSELLNDYEEGDWTPVPSSFINYTPTVQVGRYTKVGNLVTASFNMSWTSVNAGSNQFVVGGLPFNSSSTTSYASAAAIGGSDYLTASVQVFAHIQDNATSIKFFTMNSGSTKSNLLCSSWNASGSTNNIVGTVSYIV